MMTIQQAFDLALQHHRANRLAEAEALYRQILAVQPNHFDALHLLGVIAHQAGRHELAVQLIGQAVTVNPNDPAAQSNLGEVLRVLGRLEEGIASFHRAIALDPQSCAAYIDLGNALREAGQPEAAIAACRRAIALQPANPIAHHNLGFGLHCLGDLEEAIAAYDRALQLDPSLALTHNNMGNVLKDQGQIEQAIAAYRRATERNPEDAAISSNIIYSLLFLSPEDPPQISEAQRSWNMRFSEPAKRFIPAHINDRDPERPLRLGYVSPDFRQHVVGLNLVPLFKFHDHRNFQVVCYSGVKQPDEITAEFQQRADSWRNTAGLEDAELAETIRRDGIDILVDLSQHMTGNRLPVFAHQPAPVQVSFAGYPEGTGIEAIEYRISDRWLESDFQTERVFLLDSFWCYDPCEMESEVNDLPAASSGHVIFGSFNNFCKVNEPLLKLWARILREVIGSRLLLLTRAGSHRQRTLQHFEANGVERQRIEFVEPCSRRGYLELYHRLDIVLDTFPYNGHTTSLDALWMGVPVVSLPGERPVSRAGLSQLSNLGISELVAHSEEQYVEIARCLAGDLPRLAELRRGLRPRMAASVLMDAPRFARNIEAAYRAMWRQWCGRHIAIS